MSLTNTNLLQELKSMLSEGRNPNTLDLDTLDTVGILQRINDEDAFVAQAVKKCITEIAKAVDAVLNSFQLGGRLIYLGAGTSGRLGILDAVECPPTFSIPDSQVVGLIAGGHGAIFKAVEGAEDNDTLAKKDLSDIALTNKDTVVALAASGRTPYAIGGLHYANQVGASTVAVTCNPGTALLEVADIGICATVGPEALTGSTRMKSGTAQKMILNMITTTSMIKSGKSYQNLMVDVHASNKKLKARAERIVMQATGCDQYTASTALNECEQSAKLAILTVLTNLNAADARQLLEEHNGYLRNALSVSSS